MSDLPKEIADLCGIVVGYTCEDEPKEYRATYGILQTVKGSEFEVFYQGQSDPEPVTMGFIQRYKAFRGHRYKAESIHGKVMICPTLQKAVEFIHEHYA